LKKVEKFPWRIADALKRGLPVALFEGLDCSVWPQCYEKLMLFRYANDRCAVRILPDHFLPPVIQRSNSERFPEPIAKLRLSGRSWVNLCDGGLIVPCTGACAPDQY
jgi:hypothetical protein